LTIAKLGVDFGRVINDASAHPSGDDTSFLKGGEEVMLATPATPGAFESLRRLTTLFEGHVWIVSKASESTQAKTERWLAHREFYTATGIPPDHVRFVRRRAEKAAVCSELGITHFVDDRVEVLEFLVGVVPYRYLFGPQDGTVSSSMVPVATWSIAEAAISDSLASS
jgi:hypothetical protein